jgi:hypothetical protein
VQQYAGSADYSTGHHGCPPINATCTDGQAGGVTAHWSIEGSEICCFGNKYILGPVILIILEEQLTECTNLLEFVVSLQHIYVCSHGDNTTGLD